jgi:pyridoxal phosphate enzyme (YggS family)
MVTPANQLSAIADNIHLVRAQIKQAAIKAGRMADDIRLIAVSKTRPLAFVQAALLAGQQDFGENTIQDARTKIDNLSGQSSAWHFIGHLQTNKARYVPGRFQWLHTLDSVALASKLNRALANKNEKLSALIQVNITGDSAKHGLSQKDLPMLIENLLAENLEHIALRGLMTIGKLDSNAMENFVAFEALRELCEKTATSFQLPGFTELSMGMSGDFIQAIEAGSTMVRVGSQIFGNRNP